MTEYPMTPQESRDMMRSIMLKEQSDALRLAAGTSAGKRIRSDGDTSPLRLDFDIDKCVWLMKDAPGGPADASVPV